MGEVIYKFLAGTATKEERQELLDWLSASPENQAVFSDTKAIWHAARTHNKDYHAGQALDRLNRRIDYITGVDTEIAHK